jgi:glycosyltransferase involved in cell wall biosynthesis
MSETASILADTNRDSAKSVRVSYIISTRNRAKFLAEALRNAREFITPADELIVMDGASTDNTADVVAANRDIVTLFRSEPDSGEAHGFNKGILESKGRFIKFLTDDDYIYPDAMKQAIGVLEAHPEIDALLCGGESFSSGAEMQEKRFNGFHYLPNSRQLASDMMNIVFYVTCGVGLILSRRILSKTGLFDTTWLCVDTDYMSRMYTCKANFQYLNVKLFRHIEYGHSGMKRITERQRDAVRALIRCSHWDVAAGYTAASVASALNLSDYPNGNRVAEVLVLAMSFCNSRLPVLKFIAAGMRGINMCHRFSAKLMGRPLARSNIQANTAPCDCSPQIEPVWDGSLR